MSRLFVSGAWVIGGALLALVAAGPGCTGGGGDDTDGGGLGGEDAGDASGGSESSGGAGSGGANSGGSSSGGSSSDGFGGDASGGASGGGAATGGDGGLGGGGGLDCGAVPSECPEVEDLGEYSAGESLPWLPNGDRLPAGQSVLYSITFLDVVWFGGTLTTTGTGNPELTLFDADGDELGRFADVWENELLPAGEYFLRLAPADNAPLEEGYDLSMLTRSPIPVGTVTADSSVYSSTLFDFSGQFALYKFVVTAPIVLSGDVTLNSGNVDVFLFDNSADVVTSFQSPGSTESVGPLELSTGTYMIQIVGVTSSADFVATFEWDDP